MKPILLKEEPNLKLELQLVGDQQTTDGLRMALLMYYNDRFMEIQEGVEHQQGGHRLKADLCRLPRAYISTVLAGPSPQGVQPGQRRAPGLYAALLSTHCPECSSAYHGQHSGLDVPGTIPPKGLQLVLAGATWLEQAAVQSPVSSERSKDYRKLGDPLPSIIVPVEDGPNLLATVVGHPLPALAVGVEGITVYPYSLDGGRVLIPSVREVSIWGELALDERIITFFTPSRMLSVTTMLMPERCKAGARSEKALKELQQKQLRIALLDVTPIKDELDALYLEYESPETPSTSNPPSSTVLCSGMVDSHEAALKQENLSGLHPCWPAGSRPEWK